jgi:DNA-binding beta-propeller fold protein YncE
MPLHLDGYIELPPNRGQGGFDHADVHAASDRLYVAHTSNDALDVIDCGRGRYIESIPNLKAIAGALVSQERGLLFTSNRGENTVSIMTPGAERDAVKIAVGMKPNGLAFDSKRGILIAANVGDPTIPGSFTVSVIDVEQRERIGEIPVPGRTRWAIYDAVRERFFVNIMSPPKIVTIAGGQYRQIASDVDVPAVGPHGLDLDPKTGRLFCACDAGVLFAIDGASGQVLGEIALSGGPDVIFIEPELERLYVAIGDPGVIDVIDTRLLRRIETVPTEPGAHTLALDRRRSTVFAFLPETHRAAVYREA